MGKVAIDKTMSLDGFITGPNPRPERGLGDDGERLFAWMMAETAPDEMRAMNEAWAEEFSDAFTATGAVIMGKRMFEIIDSPNGWVAPDGTPFTWPVFVMMHERREPVTKGQTPFTFVNDGPASALAQAQAAAGDKAIGLGGANVAQQFIRAGLVDEMIIHLVPIFLGDGVRLFDDLGSIPREFELVSTKQGMNVTHLRFRAVK